MDFRLLIEISAFVLLLYMIILGYVFYLKRSRETKSKILKQYTYEFCLKDNNNYQNNISQIKHENNDPDLFLGNSLSDILNHFEKVAIGVKNGLLDENIIFDYYGRIFQIYYNLTKYNVLLKYRNESNDPFIFIEFEKLATKWMENKNRETRYGKR
jgi:hypothetical protein